LGGPSYVGDQPLCEPKETEARNRSRTMSDLRPKKKKKKKKKTKKKKERKKRLAVFF